jgi:transcriptional regulator with XRE-family HTH domain
MHDQSRKYGPSLGAYLERARRVASLSIRDLEAATGIPKTTLTRILKDQISQPDPRYLTLLANALKLNAANAFVLAGLPIPQELPSIEAYLRLEHPNLPESAIIEAKNDIEAIVAKYTTGKSKNSTSI